MVYLVFEDSEEKDAFLQSKEGIISFIALVCNVYFLLKPSVFGWYVVLVNTFAFAVFESAQTLFYLEPEELLLTINEPWPSRVINLLIEMLISGIIFWYLYKKKDYFYGVPQMESARENVLDDEL